MKFCPTFLSFCGIAGGITWTIITLIGLAPTQTYLLAALCFLFAYSELYNHYRAR